MPAKLNSETVDAILRAGQSPRYRRLDGYYRHWDGSVYEGRPAFLDMSSDRPMLERAPCVVYPVVRSAVASIIALCLGQGKFPQLLSMTSESGTTFDPRFGLSKPESVIIDAGNQAIIEQTRSQAVFPQIAEMAKATGTAVVFVSVNRGRLKYSQLDPRNCTPEFNPLNPDEVVAVEISYRYVEDVWFADEKRWYRVPKQFRRRIDVNYDTTFIPVELRDETDFTQPTVADTSKQILHGLGFCPVVWYKHMSTVSDSADIDGRPIHWGITGLLDALNFSLSQRHRAALYCGDPQYVETGVGDDERVTVPGRSAIVIQPTANNPQGLPGSGWKFGGDGGGGGAKRRKGPGTTWSYQDAAVKVQMLTLPGDALAAINDHAADLRSKISEALGVVFIDPATLKGTADISGKALAVIYANQIAACNAFREDFWRKCISPVMNIAYRVIVATPTGLYLPGVDKMRNILQRFNQPLADGSINWFEPSIKPVWGDYFEASDNDESVRASAGLACYAANAITLKTLVEHLRPVFAIANVDDYVAQLAIETAQRQAAAVANQIAMSPPQPPAAQPGKPAATPPAAAAAPVNAPPAKQKTAPKGKAA